MCVGGEFAPPAQSPQTRKWYTVEKLHLYVLAVACFAAAGLALVTTTGMSASGLANMFPTIPGIAFFGYALAAGAVVLASVTSHMFFHKNWVTATITGILCASLIIGEFMVNDHSTGDTAHNQIAADSEAVARYHAAKGREADLAKDIAAIVTAQELILKAKPNPATGNAEIKAIQRIMKGTAINGEPAYKGLIDGEEKGLTQQAIGQYGIWAEGRLTELRTQQKADNIILDTGLPVVKDSGVISAFAKFMALFATLFAALMAVVGDILLCRAMAKKEPLPELVAGLEKEYGSLLNKMGTGRAEEFADRKVIKLRR